MPYLKNYHILISHSWDYNQQYETIKSWLNEAPFFSWTDYSVPLSNPLDVRSINELKNKLRSRISMCSCVIVLSGMYVVYSDWIDFEIQTSISYGKPVIGIRPWGAERIPIIVQEKSNILVNWNAQSVINAIRNFAI